MAHCTSCYNCGCDQWPIEHHVITGCKSDDQWPIVHHVIIVVVRMCVINGPLNIML